MIKYSGVNEVGLAIRDAAQLNGFQLDSKQTAVIGYFEDLAEKLVKKKMTNGFLSRICPKPSIYGVYLWGGVGRGKTFIVDSFYHAVPIDKKKRIHFHQFMDGVHKSLRKYQGHKNPLKLIGKEIEKDTHLLCLDELQVTDIGDAMIMQNLLTALFVQRVAVVATSNTEPANLYKDGLQREKFLPAIDQIESNMQIVELDSGADYRMTTFSRSGVYYHPINEVTELKMQELFLGLAKIRARDDIVRLNNRDVQSKGNANGVIWFTFSNICGGPRAQPDYIDIAKQYHTVMVSEVPLFDLYDLDRRRRFTWLVDELYDQRVNLILSAEVSVEGIFKGVDRNNEVLRTQSRLIEMQGEKYLRFAHGKPHQTD